jgi:mRNA interferase MazF
MVKRARYAPSRGDVIFCPITTQVKGCPFEVAFPDGCHTQGVVLADQVKSVDHAARRARFFERAPDEVVEEVLAKIRVLVEDGGR